MLNSRCILEYQAAKRAAAHQIQPPPWRQSLLLPAYVGDSQVECVAKHTQDQRTIYNANQSPGPPSLLTVLGTAAPLR